MAEKMKDQDIRTILLAELNRRYAKDTNTLILEEFGVKNGAARIDLVIINHRIHGYEIKSDLDSLNRLSEQVRIFSCVVDRMTLVVGYRHAYNALKMVPEWWGVRLAEKKEKGGVVLTSARLSHNNPSIDLQAAVALLWRDEGLTILEKMGEADGVRTKTRGEIFRRLVAISEPDSLRSMIRQQLRSRKEWRVGARYKSNDD
jgi:hypothetical protein